MEHSNALTSLVMLDTRVGARINKLLASLLGYDGVLLAHDMKHGRVEWEVVCKVGVLGARLEATDGNGDYTSARQTADVHFRGCRLDPVGKSG